MYLPAMTTGGWAGWVGGLDTANATANTAAPVAAIAIPIVVRTSRSHTNAGMYMATINIIVETATAAASTYMIISGTRCRFVLI